MLVDGNEAEQPETPEYDGGRDISAVVDAAAKADATAAPTEATPAAAPVTVADQQKAVARAWKAYREDAEVKDLDPTKMTAAEFLALKFGYTANGKEQRRDFDGIIRNAQQGHYNADVRTRIETERDKAVGQWREQLGKVTTYEGERKVWTQALTAATRGNFEPLRTIVEQFQKAYEQGEQPQAQSQQVPEGYVRQADLDAQRAGERVYNETIMPEATKLAKQFGFTAEQVATAVVKMAENYPQEFLTPQVLQDIMHVELPNILTRLREEHPAPAPEVSAEAKRITELEAKLAALTSKQVEGNNAAVTAVHKRREAAPPGVPTVAAGASEMESPNFDGAAGAREWLKNLK